MIRTPSNLELLLHCYYSNAPHPRHGADAILEGTQYLLRHQLIVETKPHEELSGPVYSTTSKGRAFIDHLMEVPFPEQHWIVPNE